MTRRLSVFNSVTLDGYFTDAKGDMSWAHKAPDDAEWNDFTAGNVKGNGVLVFGRVTYDMMASFWPTPAAMQSMPNVANRMNSAEKIVFSRTMDKAAWQNTKVIKADPAAEMKRLKNEAGDDMVILGSGTIVAQLAQAGLIDEYQLVVVPIALGKGRTMFDGVNRRIELRPISTRTFKNGSQFVRYEPVS
jgi:dihydrofolate reductase